MGPRVVTPSRSMRLWKLSCVIFWSIFCVVVPRVPDACLAECPSPGQKSQERARLKKYLSWLGLKMRNKGCYWCAKLSDCGFGPLPGGKVKRGESLVKA